MLCFTGSDNNQMVSQRCTSYTICSLFGAFWFYKLCESGKQTRVLLDDLVFTLLGSKDI